MMRGPIIMERMLLSSKQMTVIAVKLSEYTQLR